MTHRNVYQRLGYRISEEVQLIAEEKWMVEALTKIKNQRNSLQIERLHLESLKTKLNINTKRGAPETIGKFEEDTATTSAVNLMQHVTAGINTVETAEKVLTVNEASCNEEELNLMVSDSLYANMPNNSDFNMEEDEDESDDDMFIDMNMLMNGMSQERTRYNLDK